MVVVGVVVVGVVVVVVEVVGGLVVVEEEEVVMRMVAVLVAVLVVNLVMLVLVELYVIVAVDSSQFNSGVIVSRLLRFSLTWLYSIHSGYTERFKLFTMTSFMRASLWGIQLHQEFLDDCQAESVHFNQSPESWALQYLLQRWQTNRVGRQLS